MTRGLYSYIASIFMYARKFYAIVEINPYSKRRLYSLTFIPQNIGTFFKHSILSVSTTSKKVKVVDVKAHRKLTRKLQWEFIS